MKNMLLENNKKYDHVRKMCRLAEIAKDTTEKTFTYVDLNSLNFSQNIYKNFKIFLN